MNGYKTYSKFSELFSDTYHSYVYRLEEHDNEIDVHTFFPKVSEEDIKRLEILEAQLLKNEELFDQNCNTITGAYIEKYKNIAIKELRKSFEIVLSLIMEEAESIIPIEYHQIENAIDELEERLSKERKEFIRQENFFINH